MASKDTKFGWNFDNTYAKLPEGFSVRVNPTPTSAPKLAVLNRDLAKDLGLNADALATDEGIAIFAGNSIPQGADPIAQAYAGHQFGHFTMLGDGRADLLGEQITPSGARFDIHLKGSGPTPFSRRGDGRAALGPMLREYIISEAMHALGIPTTRSLAVVTTGDLVYRETPLPGAILTRVASSHIRVGTFEYAAVANKPGLLPVIADYTLKRHYPELASADEPYLAMLTSVIERQAALIVQWMLAGFIHGVMNTDNMTLSGETIDYGPCAFMDQYSRATVFSSIDQQGRYAYGNQPSIAIWNLSRLAETLLPLLDGDEKVAIAKAESALARFGVVFEREWLTGMQNKLGLQNEDPGDVQLMEGFLRMLEEHQADYTNSFRALCSEAAPKPHVFSTPEFADWHKQWQARKPSLELMRQHNPAVIPRNHKVEEALTAAVERGDYSVMERLLAALKAPFEDQAAGSEFCTPATNNENYQTFCGT